MSTNRWPLHAVLAGLVAATACGDDGGSPDAAIDAPTDAAIDASLTAADVEGLWLETSLTIPVQGTPVTLVRDGTPQGLRGDIVLDATGAYTAALSVRQTILVDGLLVGEVPLMSVGLLLDGGRWVITDTAQEVLVFTSQLTGDHLELDLDPDDPRTTATDPPQRIVLDRVTPWSTTTLGAWELVSMTTPGGTIDGGVCTVLGNGWARLTMTVTITDRQLFERLMTITTYTDDQCTVQDQTSSSTQTGYGEEEGGTTLRIWGWEDGTGEYQAFSMALDAGVLTLTRTACLPQPDCEQTAPLQVVMRRPST